MVVYFLSCTVGFYVNIFRAVGNGWGQALI